MLFADESANSTVIVLSPLSGTQPTTTAAAVPLAAKLTTAVCSLEMPYPAAVCSINPQSFPTMPLPSRNRIVAVAARPVPLGGGGARVVGGDALAALRAAA